MYIIEQFPKNKNLDSLMSLEQRQLRLNAIIKSTEKKRCSRCQLNQPIEEFHKDSRLSSGRKAMCKDCCAKQKGIIEIGKNRFAKKISKKGFKRCAECKDIKELSEFHKNKNNYLGVSAICKICSGELHSKFWFEEKNNIGNFYIKNYGKRVYNYKKSDFTDEIMDNLKKEILEKRQSKYFLDNKEFLHITEFGKYIEEIYGIKEDTVYKRIFKGYTETECILSEKEIRMLKSGSNKGQIKVTDLITNEIFYFKNTKDENLLKMFGGKAITIALKTKKPTNITRITKATKHINPCLIERTGLIL